MTEEIKMCVFCEHCEVELGFGGSDVTAAESDFYSCSKGNFSYGEIDEVTGWALQAMDCKNYELSHKVQAELKKRESR